MVNPEQLFQQAIRFHQAGQLPQAEALYRQVLAVQPHHPDALQNLGALACQAGQFAAAIDLISRAIALRPDVGTYYSNLGEALNRAGRREEALTMLQKAVALDPRNIDAIGNLFLVLTAASQNEEALTLVQEALRRNPNHPYLLKCLGDALLRLQRRQEALAAYQGAVQRGGNDPALADARFNLATAYYDLGRLDEAAAHYRAYIALKPNDAEPHCRVGEILASRGRFDDALACYQTALRLDPKLALAAAGSASALKNNNRVDEAIAFYRRALELDPKNAITLANLANTLRDGANVDEAIAAYQKSVELDPANPALLSGLILTCYLHPEHCGRTVQEEKARWNQRHALPLANQIQPHPNTPDPDRILRIGYISADLRSHPVARFMLPILSSHDRARFQVICYFNHHAVDDITNYLRTFPHAFREVAHLADEELTRQIRDDQIDILIDLNMHAIGNRLVVFARKPAPVQITYLAYTDGTGLSAIDYRMTDPYLDSPDADADPPSEKPLRLPETYWCYVPTTSVGKPPLVPAAEPPVVGAGHVTFGSFNYFSKVTRQALELWARLLHAVPGSRLILHAPEGLAQARVAQTLQGQGIAAGRYTLTPRLAPYDYYLLYHQIDIALDTFPYAGGTTTCDALHMGVPVVTLAGAVPTGRGGVSILSNVGLTEMIAQSEEEYLRIAVGLAGNLGRLRMLRSTLRSRLEQSPLMNIPRFVQNLEAAYRRAWVGWCAGLRRG